MPATIEVDAIALVAAHIDEPGDAQDGGTLVAVDRQQPVTALEAPGRRARFFHARDNPALVIWTGNPAGFFHEAIGAGRQAVNTKKPVYTTQSRSTNQTKTGRRV